MSPLEIQVLLHCFCIRQPFVPNSQAYRNAISRFLRRDMIIEDMADGQVIYKTTPRGDAMCEMLMTTPLPERVWVDPRSRKELG